MSINYVLRVSSLFQSYISILGGSDRCSISVAVDKALAIFITHVASLLQRFGSLTND